MAVGLEAMTDICRNFLIKCAYPSIEQKPIGSAVTVFYNWLQ